MTSQSCHRCHRGFRHSSTRLEGVKPGLWGQEGGFTLIELLTATLIIGVLAAIALPSFIGTAAGAGDAQAKALANSAQTAAETLATGDEGNYEVISKAELHQVEPTIRIAASTSEAYVSAVKSSRTTYSITTKATDGDRFTVSMNKAGEVTRECVSPTTKTGCEGHAQSNW